MSDEQPVMSDDQPAAGERKGYQQAPKPLTDDEKKTLMQLDLERGRGGGGSGGGRLGCLLKLLVVGTILASPCVAFMVFQPWETRSEQVPTNSDLCTDGERAMTFRERFIVLGYEVSDKSKGVVCISNDD